VASCALLLLGIALGLGHPRFQKGGAVVKSLGVILVYYLGLKYVENHFLLAKSQTALARVGLFALPLLFLAAGFFLMWRKLHPHHANRLAELPKVRILRHRVRLAVQASSFLQAMRNAGDTLAGLGRRLISRRLEARFAGRGVLATWTIDLWFRSWGSVMGTFLALSLLIEYASLAGDLVHNHVSVLVFIRYWVWNLPSFLAVVLPLAFLLGGVLTLAEATVSREWTAMRAGGISFLQWCGAGFRGWGAVLACTFILQAFAAPVAFQRADPLYQQILGRPAHSLKTRPSWLNLGSTGVIWFLDGLERWGFPLKAPGADVPILLKWDLHAERSQALPWDSLNLVDGPKAVDLFPSRALRDSTSAEETSTLDLFQWQKWAPDPERATMIWSRLLGFLAGPCLLFAILPYAFPSPRGGRGQALGFSLVAGLVFMGLQALFSGAAKAGEFPAIWGVACPLLLLLGFGLANLHRLRT
jgi:lipopolysaccharide export LptBFGC system permease protein LptF